jgi:hypothetical protein
MDPSQQTNKPTLGQNSLRSTPAQPFSMLAAPANSHQSDQHSAQSGPITTHPTTCCNLEPLGRDPYRKAGRGGLGRVGPPWNRIGGPAGSGGHGFARGPLLTCAGLLLGFVNRAAMPVISKEESNHERFSFS